MLSIVVLLLVFVLIAVRQIVKIRYQIWQVMLAGALAVLVTGQISPSKALQAINPDVMLFLFGMFIVGQALDESGYLSHLSHRMFSRAKSLDHLVLLVLFGMGILSAFLMNDTLAIIGTPVMLFLARRTGAPGRVLLLSLAFAITIGSAMSPIGNPQNLLIAISGNLTSPFVTFFKYLLIPTLINLFLAYLLLRLFYRRHFLGELLSNSHEQIQDQRLAKLSKASLILLGILILAKIVTVLISPGIDFRLTYIALASALPIVLLSPKRLRAIRRIDWHTLVFFAAMFILMESVWDSGIFQSMLDATHLNMTSTGVVLGISVVLSQFISNVPFVALYLPLIIEQGAQVTGMMALAAGSTIAGNFSILGAASNVIIIQNAEKNSRETLTFTDFLKVGVPLTTVNIAVYWLFLEVILKG
jgi:Na+/H+ antiporter NhaD/arsenite permease-like protein